MSVIDLPRPLAYALGGAASSAAAQVGMLRAAADAGLEPDLIVGTSSGALNGALLADDPRYGLERLADIWVGLEPRSIISSSRTRLLRNVARRQFMYEPTPLRRLFAEHVSAHSIEALSIRFATVATDLGARTPAILDRGPLLSALLASCAIPGVFPPVERDGLRLVDGLCVANVPVRQALALGAASIVVFDGRSQGFPSPWGDVRDGVFAAFDATLKHQLRCDVEYARERVPVWCVPGQPATHVKAFRFDLAERLMEDAYRAASAHLRSDPSVLVCE